MAQVNRASSPRALAEWISSRDWWHGASDDAAGAKIAHDGMLKPRRTSGADYERLRGVNEVPSRPGRVYLAGNLLFALDYAVGSWWSLAPEDWTLASVQELIRAKGAHGWIFRVDGAALVRSAVGRRRVFEPDEDAVGYAVYRAAQRIEMGNAPTGDYEEHELDGRLPNLKRAVIGSKDLARRVLDAVSSSVSDLDYEDCLAGETRGMARVGKQMMARLPVDLGAVLIMAGASLAVGTEVLVAEALRFHRSAIAVRAHDASSLLGSAVPIPLGVAPRHSYTSPD